MESVTFDKVTYIHGECLDYMWSLPDNAAVNRIIKNTKQLKIF